MNQRSLKISCAAGLIAIIALGCASAKVMADTEKLAGIKKIALLETLIEKPAVTAMSGLKQGATEEKFAALAESLNKVAATEVEHYREIAAKKIASEFSATVLSGKQLAQAVASAEKDGISAFPVSAYKNAFSVAQASGEKNFIDAPEGEFGAYLPKADLSTQAKYFCEKLNVDAIAFAVTKVVFVIQQDKAILGTALVIYDRAGNRVFVGSGAIDPPLDVANASDLAGFTKLMQKHVYARTLDLIFVKLNEQRAKK